MNDIIGKSLGRYHILEQLGEGGMAIVYKAYDTRLERDVAVKIIRKGAFPADHIERILKRFEREAKALARLSHPNILKIHDYGEHEGSPYLVMEYLPGGTLKQKMGKPMPWQAAVQLLLPIAEALDYAHSQNMIHRDVKPANILLTQRGQPMLTDFGIAKVLDLEETLDLTGTSAAVGTPEYMAPEQATAKFVDHRVDIYSLGVVLYEMVTGRKPFIADTPMAVLIKHATEALPRPTQFAPNLPDGVEKVLLKALAKQPENRYQDMGEMAAAFKGMLESKVLGDTITHGLVEKSMREKAERESTEKAKSEKTEREDPKAKISKEKFEYKKIITTLIIFSGVIIFGLFGLPLIANRSSPEPFATTTLTSTSSKVAPSMTINPSQISNGNTISNSTPTNSLGSNSYFDLMYLSEQDSKYSLFYQSQDGDKKKLSENFDFIYITSPALSPNEQFIAFGTDKGIYQININSGVEERLSTFGVNPVWSPDNLFIAFENGDLNITPYYSSYECTRDYSKCTATKTDYLSNQQIYLIELTNETPRVDKYPLIGYRGTILPAWNNNGSKFAFVKRQNVDFLCARKYPFQYGDDKCIQIKNNVETFAWHPMEDKIIFSATQKGDSDIFLFNFNDFSQTNLTEGVNDDFSPIWDHTGEKIAFVSNRDENNEIYLLNIASLEVENITKNISNDYSPIWSPDDKKIIFISDRSNNLDIFSIDIETRETINLTNSPSSDEYSPIILNTNP